MKEFKSWRDFGNFERMTKNEERYIHTAEVETFLDTVLQSSTKRTEVLPSDSCLWRAQLGHGWRLIYENGQPIDDEPAPYPPERMKPEKKQANEGRANPKGISYLYLATHRDTALAEVRPWIGSLISVCCFRTSRELHLINCVTDNEGNKIYLQEPSPEKREEAVWVAIDRAFARPVNLSDGIIDYIPTQIIAELFKIKGFDGVAYRSSLGEGHNIVLFDLDSVSLIRNSLLLLKCESIKFNFRG
jgi:hypothetical protein